MERLRAPEDRGKRLNSNPDDVVLGLLGRQRAAGGLRVEAQLEGALILCPEPLLHYPGPQAARCSELGYLLKEVVVHVEEEREA